MGTSVRSDIVKNVAYIVDRIAALDEFNETEENEQVEINGWQYFVNGGNAGKKKRLYVETFRRDGMEVYYLNTAHYADVGDEYYAVFSDDVEAVKTFLNDFGIKAEIDEDYDSIQQTT